MDVTSRLLAKSEPMQTKHAQRAERVFVRAVRDLRAGHVVGKRADRRLIAIHDHDLVMQAHELLAQVTPEAPQSNNQNRFHLKLLFGALPHRPLFIR